MDAKQFLSEFALIASAPGGIQKLRQMIYNLAITGDLTQQLTEDGNAESLLRDIKNAKAHLIEKRAFKRSPKLEDQPLYVSNNIKLPDSWCWSRLVDIGEINPKNEVEADTLGAFIRMEGIPQLHSGKLRAEQRPWRQIKSGFTHFADGDVVLAKITPCFENGKAAVITGLINGIGAGTTELHVVRPLREFVNPAYIYIFLRSPYFIVEGERNMTGTAGQKRLPTEYFATRAFPLPPIAEQKRIVAKVDELMVLCDKLEAQQQERDELCKLTRTTVFNALSNAQSIEERTKAWRRVQLAIPMLIEQGADVGDLRTMILDLATTGCLTESVSNDSKVGELIEDAEISWNRHAIYDKIIDKSTSPASIKNIDIPMPSHWIKMSIKDLFRFIDYRGKTPTKTASGRVLITAKNVRPGRIESNPVEYISEASYQEWMTRGFPRIGDLLITTEAPLGNVALIEEEPQFALAQRVINLQPYKKMHTDYFMFFMMSPRFQQLLRENATGTTAKGIKAAKLKLLNLSVPPYEEQGRIVQIIKRLLSFCEQLEKQLDGSRSLARQIASVSTSIITGISTIPSPK